MNTRKAGTRGMALIFVLIAVFCMFLFFISFQYFSQSEYRHLNKVMSNLTLDYLVRMGLNIAEDKLQKGRWYGDTTSHEKYEVPNIPVPGAGITIYCDDYCRKDWKRIGKFEYAVLDHVKVFVEATYKGFKMYGYGKFIFSPEPLLMGTSTKGVDIISNSSATCPLTFRKMIHVRLIKEVKLISNVPSFSTLSDFGSRKALAAYLKTDLFRYSENYSRNIRLAKNIMQSYLPTGSVTNQGSLVSFIKGLDSVPPPKTGNWTQNFFIFENMKNFPMDVNWDAIEAGKPSELGSVKIEFDNFTPGGAPDPELLNAIRTVYGNGHPQILVAERDFYKEFSSSGEKSAVEEYIEKRGITGLMEKKPRDLQDEMSKVATRYAYHFQWKASGVISGPGGDLGVASSTGGNVAAGGAPAFNFYYGNQGNSKVFLPDGKVTIGFKDGPTPVYSNYFMMKGTKKIPLAFVFNIFMKYVDENAIYTPDSPTKEAGQCVTPLPPEPASPTVREWDDVYF